MIFYAGDISGFLFIQGEHVMAIVWEYKGYSSPRGRPARDLYAAIMELHD
jgi:hypothetical protein